MSSQPVHCPRCQARVFNNRRLPDRALLRCPECDNQFLPHPSLVEMPEPEESAEQPPAGGFSREGLIAVVAATIVCVGGIGTALVVTREAQPVPAVAAEQEAGRKRLDEERLKLELDRKALEQDKRKLEIGQLMSQAAVAVAERRYADAEKIYGEVLKLAPEHADAVKGLINVRLGLAADTKAREEETGRKSDYAKLMAQGKEAMAKKQFSLAMKSFAVAGQAKPGDADALVALNEAEQSQAAEESDKRKQMEYQTHIDSAKLAMTAKRYQEAIQAYAAAQKVLPNDAAAVAGQKQAEDRLKDQEEKVKVQNQYSGLMERANFALKNRRYDSAIEGFEAALKLVPEDREARTALRETQQAKKNGRGEFNKLMAQGNNALQNQRIEEAARAYSGAAALFPEDATAARMVKQLDKTLGNIQTAQAAYLRAILQGGLALRNGLFADAVRAYAEALRISPNDPEALLGLREAQANLNIGVAVGANYQQSMNAATQAVQQRRYGEAIKAYSEALRLVPDDLAATRGLRLARYQQAMAQAQTAMVARKFADAVRAYQDALRENPGDAQAQVGLRQAQALRR